MLPDIEQTLYGTCTNALPLAFIEETCHTIHWGAVVTGYTEAAVRFRDTGDTIRCW